MSPSHRSSIPHPVFSAFVGLIPIGVLIGILCGVGAMEELAVSAVVFGGLGVFVPWAVLKLDPRRLAEVADEMSED
jgi:predicted branched-subunit amino acid permease